MRKSLMRKLLKLTDTRRSANRRSNHDNIYTDEEMFWLDAMAAFKEANNIRFPTETDRLWVARQLGMIGSFDISDESLLRLTIKN
jgi:hypothetical protein